MPKILRELQKKKRAELVKIAAAMQPPLEVKNHWTTLVLAKRIRDRQLTDEAENLSETDQPEEPAQQKTTSEFVNLANQIAGKDVVTQDAQPTANESSETEVVENRGGARPGAGRPPGSPNGKKAVEKLFSGGFAFWAMQANEPRLRLTAEEAAEFGDAFAPFIAEVGDIIPDWVWNASIAAMVTINIVGKKIAVLKENEQKQLPEDKAHETNRAAA